MSYELINKELNIWSCNISDLTAEQVDDFLKQWESGSKISSLSVFYEPADDKVVINKDIQGFDDYAEIISKYLMLSEKDRVECRKFLNKSTYKEPVKEYVKRLLDVLDEALFNRKMKNLEKILGMQSWKSDKIREFGYLMNNAKNKARILSAIDLYNYGFMEGVRAERTRRKARKGVSA